MLTKYKIKGEHILLIVVVAAGLAARLQEVGYNLDVDEFYSVRRASKHFTEVFLRSLDNRPHPPLYDMLLHPWMKVFGVSEVSARLLSVLFSGAFLFTAYAVLRRFLTPWLALSALSLLSLSPLFVYYGQQARPYALITFLSTANLLAFLRVLESPGERRRLALWAALCALWLYAQYVAALFIALQIGIAFCYLRSERLTILSYGLAGSVLILPWLLVAMGDAIVRGTDPLSQISWMGAPTSTDFLRFYVSIFGGESSVRVRWLLVILAILGMAYVRQCVALRSLPAEHLLLLLLGLVVPAVIYVASAWGPKPVFAERQLLCAAVAFVMTIGLCLATLPRILAVGFFFPLLVWTTMAFPQAFPSHAKPPWRDMAARIDAQYGSLPVIVFETWMYWPLTYYRQTGPVRLWSELTEHEKDAQLPVACRSFNCSAVEAEGLISGRSLLATWQWGSFRSAGKHNQLRLYELKSVD